MNIKQKLKAYFEECCNDCAEYTIGADTSNCGTCETLDGMTPDEFIEKVAQWAEVGRPKNTCPGCGKKIDPQVCILCGKPPNPHRYRHMFTPKGCVCLERGRNA